MSKRVLIISNFHEEVDTSRSKKAYDFYKSNGFAVEVLYCGFSHSLKCHRNINLDNHIKIKTISYNRNVSIRRIISHLIYTINVMRFIRKEEFGIIYIIFPPNILSLAVIYGRKKSKKIILDIIDLWPEAFKAEKRSIKNLVFAPIYLLSTVMRNKSMKSSDVCLTESHYFSNVLGFEKYEMSRVLYLSKRDPGKASVANTSEELTIAYLGNIGHVYDFDSLFYILSEIKKRRPVTLHVIGTGPREQVFFDTLKTLQIKFEYYGATFDEELKQNVLSRCWFGFNGYKVGSPVALSYKTIDYLSYGLPLLNSAVGDTANIVDSEKIGLNYSSNELNVIIENLSCITLKELGIMKKDAYNTFLKEFSDKSYDRLMNNITDDLYK